MQVHKFKCGCNPLMYNTSETLTSTQLGLNNDNTVTLALMSGRSKVHLKWQTRISQSTQVKSARSMTITSPPLALEVSIIRHIHSAHRLTRKSLSEIETGHALCSLGLQQNLGSTCRLMASFRLHKKTSGSSGSWSTRLFKGCTKLLRWKPFPRRNSDTPCSNSKCSNKIGVD